MSGLKGADMWRAMTLEIHLSVKLEDDPDWLEYRELVGGVLYGEDENDENAPQKVSDSKDHDDLIVQVADQIIINWSARAC